jgi:hypothetical protein
LTLGEKPPGTYAICPVCWWEDDDLQFRDPDYQGGANKVSLRQARENFQRYGASEFEHKVNVRKPFMEELPDGNAGDKQ